MTQRTSARPSSLVRGSRLLLAVGVLGAALTVGSAQQPPAPEAPPQPEGSQAQRPLQPTFRVEANFVRVDVFPTIDGKTVRDLTAADFELLEDGKPQRIETFEYVQVRGGLTQEARREPNNVREAREMAEDPRSRVFVVFLDTYHTDVAGSHRMRQSLINLLDQAIGPDDLFGVMTPEMSARDITLARRTTTTEGMLSKYWYWGRRDRITDRDPEERLYESCFPENSMPRKCLDPTDPTSQRAMEQAPNTYAGVAQEMIARRREKRVLDALADLAMYLRGIREERKAVLAISNGWLLFRPNRALARIGVCEAPPAGPRVGVGPDGRITTDEQRERGFYSQQTCETDRQHLANLDNWQTYHDLLGLANRSNVSFYPIDSRGLAATDAEIIHDLPPRADQLRLAHRIETLRTLADQTDGLAVVDNNDIDKGIRRVVEDLTSYYLLGYYSSNSKLDGKFRSIKVRVKRPGVDVRARRGYRAATEEEMSHARDLTASATAAAPPSLVQVALGSLAGLRPNLSLRTHVSWIAAPLDDAVPGAKSHVWVVGEIDPAAARSAEWALGGEAEVLLTAEDGVKLAEVKQPVEPAARVVSVQLSDVALAPGDFVLRLRVRPSQGGLPFLDTIRFTVPEETSTAGQPRVLRRGPATGLDYLPTADLRFRRTDRLRVELPVLGTVDAVTAELLDRNAQPIPLPVQAAAREDGDPVLRWASAELALAPLAPGDYVLRTMVEQGSGRQEIVTAFRIVP